MRKTYNYKPENMGPVSQEIVLNSASVIDLQPIEVRRVLRNTYALLTLTLLLSAGVAATSLDLQLPASGLILTLATVSLYVLILNLLTSSLNLFGIGGNND